MKTKVLSLVALFTMGAFTVFAGNKMEEIKVKGECGMCETRIEKAANAVDGVSKADWDKKTKILAVTFDDAKTTTDKIEMAVAKVGHDTPHHKAKDEVYEELPSCCHYDRSTDDAEKSHEGHMH